MNGYHILGGVIPPYQVLQQQNAGLPPGSVPPWYAMQYPAGYVPPLLVSVDNPLEEDPFAYHEAMLLRHHDEREQEGLRKSHLLGFYGLFDAEDDAQTFSSYALLGAAGGSTAIVEVSHLLNRIYAHREKDPAGGPDLLKPNVVTYATARDLVKMALPAIDRAKKIAPEGWFVPTKEKTMANIRDALVRHERTIDVDIATGKTGAYPDAESLRKDVLRAFVEVEGSIAGAEAQAKLSYWAEVYEVLRDIGDAVLAIGKDFARGVQITSLVLLALVGLLGYAAFKILVAAAPTVAPLVTSRYLR